VSPSDVKKLAVIVSHGSFNSLVQVVTLLQAAVGSDIAVRVFFRDESVLKVTKTGAGEVNLSEAYRGREEETKERLRAQDLLDLPSLLREVKRLGDVRLYVCSSSMAICGVRSEDILSEIDEVRGLTTFLLEDIAEADRVLTF
jgi:peroxiredoxin family protein